MLACALSCGGALAQIQAYRAEMLVDMNEFWRTLFAVAWVVCMASVLIALDCSVEIPLEMDHEHWIV